MEPESSVFRVHFEDRSGTEFERLCFAYISHIREWHSIDWYGQVGADSGRDIWAVLKADDGIEHSYCYQCANHRSLRFKKAQVDIDKMTSRKQSVLPDHFVLIAGGQVSARLKGRIISYAESKGLSSVQVWSGPELEERIRKDAPHLIRRFCEGEPFPEGDLRSLSIDNHPLSMTLNGHDELISWCSEIILNDQFTTGDARGAWSKKYPAYLDFVYGSTLPSDIGIRDTISYSAWIAIALRHYLTILADKEQANRLTKKLVLLQDYLRRHYQEGGGFGLTKRPKSRTPSGIDVDLRHTCWAMITLWELGAHDPVTNRMLQESGRYVLLEMDKLNRKPERAITYAVLHRLLSTERLCQTVIASDEVRSRELKNIEGIVIDKLDRITGTWDLEHDPLRRATIDNALIVLYAMPVNSCLDSDCSKALSLAIARICVKLIETGVGAFGLPFYEGGDADIGASLLLLYILKRDQTTLSELKEYVEPLRNFVTNPANRDELKLFVPWYLASAFHLI